MTHHTRPETAPTPPSDADLRALVERNRGQGTFDEYRLLRDRIVAAAPGNVLIFGVGRDSDLWIRANAGGRTVFLEDVPAWIDVCRAEVPGIEIERVSYRTRRFLWTWYLRRPEPRLTMRDLPAWIRDTAWDLILVDAPQGQSWKRPGRMQSIWEAARLAAANPSGADVLVHDCHREVEATCADRFLGRGALVTEVDHMRLYRVGAPVEAQSTEG